MTRLDREQQWEQNTHMKLVSTITTALNLTKCWICHRFPEHSNKRKVPLVGIRIPSLNNHSTWELLWQQPRAFLYYEGSEEAQSSLAKQVIIEESVRCLKSQIGSQSVGEYPDSNYNTTLSGSFQRKQYQQYYLQAPQKGLFWFRGDNIARRDLPPYWKGACTLGAVVTNIRIIKNVTQPRNQGWIRQRRSTNPLAEQNGSRYDVGLPWRCTCCCQFQLLFLYR